MRLTLLMPLLTLFLAMVATPSRAERLLVDLTPGSSGSYPSVIYGADMEAAYVAGGYLIVQDCKLFALNGDADNSTLLFTASGAAPCAGRSSGRLGDRLVFTMRGNELWTSTGTIAGTIQLGLQFGGTAPNLITTWQWPAFPGWMLVGVGRAAAGQDAIWITNGTAAGTRQLQVTGNSFSVGFMGDGRAALFGDGLWSLASPTANAVAVSVGTFTDGGAYFADVDRQTLESGARVFFKATTPASGSELWSTDLTLAGTGMVVDHTVGAGSTSISSAISPYDASRVYYVADQQLYFSTIGSGTSTKLNPTNSVVNGAPFPIGGDVVLVEIAQTSGYGLWKFRDGPMPILAAAAGAPGPASSSIMSWRARWPERSVFGVSRNDLSFGAFAATPTLAPTDVLFTGISGPLGGGEKARFHGDHLLGWSAFGNSVDLARGAAQTESVSTNGQNLGSPSTYFAPSGGPSQLFVRDNIAAGREPHVADLPNQGVPMCSATRTPIADNATTTDLIDIRPIATAGSWRVLDARVHVKLRHSYVGDLTIVLNHLPTGRTATLLQRPGAEGCTGDNLDVVFDDAAAVDTSTCADGGPAFPAMQPLRPVQPLAAFFGDTYGGQWQLTVADAANGDDGGLAEWCLELGVGVPDPLLFRNSFE